MKNSTSIGKLAGAAVVLSALGFAPQPAGAAVITTGCAGGSFGADCGLDELLAGGTLTITNTVFSGFTLANLAGSAIDASAIRVDAIDVALNPGFTFVATGGALTRADGEFTVNDLGLNVSFVLPNVLNLRIKDNTLEVVRGAMSGAASYTSVFETVLSPDFVDVFGNKLVACDGPACANTTGTDAAAFDPVMAVAIVGGLDVVSEIGGVAEITSLTLRFSQVPEPGSLALLALGAAAFAARRRKT